VLGDEEGDCSRALDKRLSCPEKQGDGNAVVHKGSQAVLPDVDSQKASCSNYFARSNAHHCPRTKNRRMKGKKKGGVKERYLPAGTAAGWPEV
jgi:hypothetical protein